MKTSEYYINRWWYEATIITKDQGNTGYFIRYGDPYCYDYMFITKRYLINVASRFETNERKIKLIALEILNE